MIHQKNKVISNSNLFPQFSQPYLKIQDINQLRSIIIKQAKKKGYKKFFKNTIKKAKQSNLYLYCHIKQCKAKLIFQKRQQFYVLTKFANQHNHSLLAQTDSRPNYDQIIRNGNVQRYLNNLKNNKNLKNKFYYQKQKLSYLEAQSFLNVYKDFQKKLYNIFMLPQQLSYQEIPKLLVLISPKMKKYCATYGQLINIIFIQNAIQEYVRQNDQQVTKNYNLILMTGRNNSNKLILFGIAICLNDKNYLSVYLSHIFQYFLKINWHQNFTITIASSPIKQIQTELFQFILLIIKYRHIEKISLSQIVDKHLYRLFIDY